MQIPTANEFIFSPRLVILRHVVYWAFYLTVWAVYWTLVHSTFVLNFYRMVLLLPYFILFSYPLVFFVVPRLLLNTKYFQFLIFILCWGTVAWYFNAFYRYIIFIPGQEWIGLPAANYKLFEPNSFLCLTTTAGCMTISSLVKEWAIKQKVWLQSEKDKIDAQLQLLKAQLHPHFLFNTLNNIYSFALEQSPKTPEMILKLSSLLSYMLYDCKSDEVLLEKEVEVMKNYIDLEKERYGDKIDISLNVEGEIHDKYISPLLILPFIENAFKHGTSEQLDNPWLSVDISVKDSELKCKVVNSKNEFVPFHENGVGIDNVKKRLEYLYANKHELKLADEGEFFVVSLLLELKSNFSSIQKTIFIKKQVEKV
ncbi:MAG: sensor histidine kinase [Chitinophagaceae bacterium]